MKQKKITDDLEALVEVLPQPIAKALEAADNSDNLLEIVLDLGSIPKARFVGDEVALAKTEITGEDLDSGYQSHWRIRRR